MHKWLCVSVILIAWNVVWYDIAPCASGIRCPVLQHPINGQVELIPNTNEAYYGSTAIFTCDVGYGQSSGDLKLTCGSSDGVTTAGDWNGDTPTCEGLTFVIILTNKTPISNLWYSYCF